MLLDTQAFKTPNYSTPDVPLSFKKGAFFQIERVVQGAKSFLQDQLATLKFWKDRMEARRELAFQSDHVLEDMGLTRSHVVQEANKWFWQS